MIEYKYTLTNKNIIHVYKWGLGEFVRFIITNIFIVVLIIITIRNRSWSVSLEKWIMSASSCTLWQNSIVIQTNSTNICFFQPPNEHAKRERKKNMDKLLSRITYMHVTMSGGKTNKTATTDRTSKRTLIGDYCHVVQHSDGGGDQEGRLPTENGGGGDGNGSTYYTCIYYYNIIR